MHGMVPECWWPALVGGLAGHLPSWTDRGPVLLGLSAASPGWESVRRKLRMHAWGHMSCAVVKLAAFHGDLTKQSLMSTWPRS